MNSFFKAKNKLEATSQIWERIAMVPDELKGAVLDAIMAYSKNSRTLKKYPMSIKCHYEKPSFALSDGDLLYGFALKKLGALSVSTERVYCGSSDTVLWHQAEQLSEGQRAPAGQVGVFVVECGSGGSGNRPWMVELWIGQNQQISNSTIAISDVNATKS
ncbi:hypothetical protein [Bdellovibrio sp. BCCA]|uniref:hypothetical protein n=1 Tax=Bdellovibrio sp. BCCA TaxID=3136281 RepID=UPI0030F2A456